MEQKLSVVVPVYNAEKYLSKCVNSILNQTYSNIELLLINDGSKDRSLELCYEFAKKDKRIKVFDKPNGGAASARNLGIREATGSYIGFCDADDYFDNDAFSMLLSVMEENNLSTVECVSRVVNNNGDVLVEDAKDKCICRKTAEEAIRDIFLRKGNVHLATRITKSEYIKCLQIPEGKRVEDFYFTILLLLNTQGTAIYNFPFYNYLLSEGSVTRSGGGNIYFDALYFYYKSLEAIKDKKYQIQEEQEYYLFKMYYLLAVSLTRKERKQYNAEIKLIKKEIKLNKNKIKANKYLLQKEKIVLQIASIIFAMPKLMYKLKNRRKQ
ncbi:MAG: glycosyltransferase family 2 protein [Clostridiales bacterium]|nr:glycosyltransferase family 2 protein [Clostridiales bacterium]